MTEAEKQQQLELIAERGKIALQCGLLQTAQSWRETYRNLLRRKACDVVLAKRGENKMRISAAFPSEYLKAADLGGHNVRVVIAHVEMRDIGDDHKPVLFFEGKEKGVVLNKTNANNIAAAYGDDTDEWTGKEVVLYEAMVDFQGRSVAAIRIRPPAAKDRPKPALKVANTQRSENPAAGGGPDFSDDIPFAPEWRG